MGIARVVVEFVVEVVLVVGVVVWVVAILAVGVVVLSVLVVRVFRFFFFSGRCPFVVLVVFPWLRTCKQGIRFGPRRVQRDSCQHSAQQQPPTNFTVASR